MESGEQQRLESWKEIATYIQRDVRTARRWELEEGLPVHRHSHRRRASVYAYPSELDAWRDGRKPDVEPESERMALWGSPLSSFATASLMLLALFSVGDTRAQSPEMTSRTVWAPGEDLDGGRPSADGRYLPFTRWSDGSFGVRDLESGQNRILNQGSWGGPEGFADINHAISPDNQWAAYTWADPAADAYVMRVAATDGSQPPRTVYSSESVNYPGPIAWTPDGQEILTSIETKERTWHLSFVSAETGAERVLKSLDWRTPSGVSMSRDGRWVAYSIGPIEGSDQRDIFVLAADGSVEYQVVEHPSDDRVVGWTPAGDGLLFLSNRTPVRSLWRISLSDGRAAGDAQLIEPNMGEIYPHGITRDGTFYFTVNLDPRDVYIARVNEATQSVESAEPVNPTELGGRRNPTWSPDGELLASWRPGEVSILSATSGEERRLTPSLSRILPRVLSFLDGDKALAIAGVDEKNRWGYYRVDLETGVTTPLFHAAANDLSEGYFTADGTRVYGMRGPELVAMDVATGEIETILTLPAGERLDSYMALSPDEDWIAVDILTEEGTRLELVPLGGGERRVLHRAGGDHASVQFLGDGQFIVFRQGDQVLRIPAQGGAAELLARAQQIGNRFALHPSGDRIAFLKGTNFGEVRVLENFLPATEE